ncbi:glycoside hydrolase family 5 protein, partial [Agromyces seonyuensis]
RRAPAIGVAAFGVLALVVGVAAPVAADATRAEPTAADVPAGFLRADGDVITDGRGNQVLLRGPNVNNLVDFSVPDSAVPAVTPLTEDDFAGMAEQGFDVVRLGMSWSALEPTRGELDDDYLGEIEQAVEWADAHDIRVVLDLHQDSWWNEGTPEGTECRAGTSPMWGYDGAPDWATITDGAPRCQFEGRDISPASDRAFQNFYFDTDGIQSALVETWGELAAVFADEPAVAGYDLLNEPGFGETAPVTTSLLLGRYTDRAIESIRVAGAPQIVFIEPSILWSGLGFDSGPAADFTDDANIVFAPHLYAESITMDRSLGIPPIADMERQFLLAERAADAYDAPLWSGEYGYWGDTADRVERLERYAALEDEHRIGSAYWVWKQACGDPQNGAQDIGDGLMVQDCATDEFAPNDALLDILSRAYPRSAPGRLTSLTADGASIALTGTTDERTCGLDVWIPGDAEPDVEVEHVDDLEVAAVEGGWRVTGCAEGEYSLTAG